MHRVLRPKQNTHSVLETLVFLFVFLFFVLFVFVFVFLFLFLLCFVLALSVHQSHPCENGSHFCTGALYRPDYYNHWICWDDLMAFIQFDLLSLRTMLIGVMLSTYLLDHSTPWGEVERNIGKRRVQATWILLFENIV